MFDCKRLFVALFGLTLAACGGGAKIGSKQGAAEALFAASAPTSQSGSVKSGLQRATASGASTVKGAHGGTATITLDVLSLGGLLGGNSSDLKFTIQYDKFNDDGKHTLDGSMTYTLKTITGGALTSSYSGKVDLAFAGKVNLTGEIDDFIDANVTESVDFQQLGTKSGSVTLSLNGTIATSTEKHTYTNETLSVTAGTITKSP